MHKVNHAVPALCLLALSAVGAGIYLVPSHKEIALMQMNDFNFSAAFKNFSDLHSEGDTSINVLAPLVNLNIYYGDVDKAIALLEAYVAEHPRTIEARKKLAELYKTSQRFDHYCMTLEELQELAPSAANLGHLVETYAFTGRNRDEMKALARLIDSDDYQPEENDYLKLASFYRVDHQTDKAINVITDYTEDNHYKVSMDTITLSIQLLQEANKENHAVVMAEAYLRRHPKEDYGIMLSTLFEARGQYESGYEILKPFLGNMERSTDLEQQVVDLLMEQKKDDEAYDILVAQRTKYGPLAPSLAVTMIDLAVTRADYDMLEALIRAQDLDKLPELALLRFADTSLQLKRPDLAKIVQSRLSEAYLKDAPVLEAVLGVAADDNAKTMATLAALPRSAIQTPQSKIIMASIFLQHDQRQRAFELLDSLAVADALDSFDAAQYATLYLDMNEAKKAEQALNNARATGSTPELQSSIDQTLVLLAAGTGKGDLVRQKLSETREYDGGLWPDAYDIAIHYHHEDLGLVIATALFKASPTAANQLQYAEALMFNNRFVEALNNLNLLVAKNDDARAMFLDAIVAWSVQAGGSQGMPTAQRTALNSIITAAMKSPNMPLEEKRDLAFVLEDIGFNDEAETLLIALAGDQPYDSPDVQELLGFWNDHPSQASVTWVVNRARRSYGNAQVVWLTYLNENEQPQAVLDLLQDASDLAPAVADQYIEALVETKNKDRLEYTLEESIETETNVVRVKNLAIIATDEDVESAAEKGWKKVNALNSNDNDAAKHLGLIEFNAGRYEVAEQLLKQYLQSGPNDYQVDLAYGEIMQQQDRKSEADPYFNRALQQISGIAEKDKPTRVDEAYLLYSTDHITESLTIFRQLLAQYPSDKEIRADLAEVLTEIGKLDEAAALLSQ